MVDFRIKFTTLEHVKQVSQNLLFSTETLTKLFKRINRNSYNPENI